MVTDDENSSDEVVGLLPSPIILFGQVGIGSVPERTLSQRGL